MHAGVAAVATEIIDVICLREWLSGLFSAVYDALSAINLAGAAGIALLLSNGDGPGVKQIVLSETSR